MPGAYAWPGRYGQGAVRGCSVASWQNSMLRAPRGEGSLKQVPLQYKKLGSPFSSNGVESQVIPKKSLTTQGAEFPFSVLT